ncbi:MAG: cell division protein [Methanobacteriota archaeon]|nr:MAG: cell division protein [Euryarchaeota archaeon]
MKTLVIGLGQAGGKIADTFLADDRKSPVPHTFEAIAVNSALSDLTGLANIPEEDRILIGETVVKGHGVGADNRLGAEIAEDEADAILNRVSKIGVAEFDAFLLVAALGGGTGSGAIPVVAKHLKEVYDEPVYAVGILPAENEGDIYTLNAARSLKTLLPSADAVILVDNGTFLRGGESVKEAYERINREIVKRIGIIARAGEVRGRKSVAEMVVDTSEIINTMRTGGICSIGYASERVSVKKRGFLSRLLSLFVGGRRDQIGKASRILSVVKRATKGRLLLPCDYRSANKALIVLAGPPSELDRKGIEKARQWLEQNISGAEVRGGDYPLPKSSYVGCVVLLAGISNAPRVRSLLERAKIVQEKVAEEPKRERDIEALLSDIDKLGGKT